MKKRIVIDIDGVIAKLHEENWRNYDKVDMIEDASIHIKKLIDKGFYVILHTSRREYDRPITLQWLSDHNIHYDEIYFDKPLGDMYIDDKAIQFKNWDNIIAKLIGGNDE